MKINHLDNLPTWVEVDVGVLLDNLAAIGDAVGEQVKILLTVKADGYGHGAVQLARAAGPVVDRFGVATVHEAVELADAGISNGILILSPILPEEIDTVVGRGFAVTAPSIDFVRQLSERAEALGRRVEAHVEIDTGMGRTGVFAEDAVPLLREISDCRGVFLGGIFSHFPVSDTDPDFTTAQTMEFRRVLDAIEDAGVSPPLRHLSNSAAIGSVPSAYLDMVRPGLLAYGYGAGLPVRPVMSWKTRIVQVRDIPAGRTISYGRTFQTRRPTIVGVLPVGYGHGYPFRLSGKGHVLVGGAVAPILGRVTMDMTMVDLTDVGYRPAVGEEAVLVGEQGGARVTIDDLAAWAETLSYEVLCGISKRVPRIYRRRGRVEAVKSLLGVSANHDQG